MPFCLVAMVAVAIFADSPMAGNYFSFQGGVVTRRATKSTSPSDSKNDAARLNNLGVAYMNQQDFDRALKLFDQAYAQDSELYVAWLNRGIALLNQQHLDEALRVLQDAAARLPNDARVWYNLGILFRAQNQPDKSVQAFEHAAQLAPGDADAPYFLGVMYTELQEYDEAIPAFNRALAINPFHASAEFGLGRAYQRKNDSANASEHLARFQKLVQDKLGSPISLRYGDQGPLSLAEDALAAPPRVPSAIPVRFTPVSADASLRSKTPGVGALSAGTGACWLDYNNDGRPDLFLVNGSTEGSSVLLKNTGDGHFEDVTHAAQLDVPGAGLGCAAGDYDNDGKTDLVVAYRDGIRLFRNQGDGTFRDVTESAGIRRAKNPVSVAFVDYDHDGDLDLYVVYSSTAPGAPARNELWRNNGNGTFTDWSEQSGLGVPATGAGVLATDFNNDRAVDLVLTGTENTAVIYLNPREGRFKSIPAWDPQKEKLPPTVGVVALDFDKDGWMDLAFTHAGGPGLTLWRNVEGKRLERVPLPDFHWDRGSGLAALDYDNDGWIDLIAAGETASGGELRLLRNMGPAGFADVTKAVGLDRVKLSHPQSLTTADFDSDGDSDILVTQADGPPVLLRNDGGNKNHWLRLSLKAVGDNKSSAGTKVEVFAGALYQKWEISAGSGYLGQSSTDLLVGLGSQREADIVRLLWPTGVPQDEIHIAAGATRSITELDRRGSSCPVLFAWAGDHYEFIADMIGPGIVGHWVAPGERNISDPTEYMKVDGGLVRPRNGRLSFRFAEPMEEVVYLDQVRLLAVDHPAGVEVYPNERFLSNPPFPEFKVIASRGAHSPLGARDDRGRNVLPNLLTSNRHYVDGFDLVPFKGFAKMHALELDLGEWDSSKPLRLLMHGFTDYFTATSMYAADQAGMKPIAPYVEARDPSGKWVRVIDDMGFPAGLARTMVADLTGHLPPGTRTIRLVTNLMIYWDQILIDNTADGPDGSDYRVTEVPLAEASLAFHGYPREKHGDLSGDIYYVHEDVSPTGPYARPVGNYTRYGDVTILLKDSDDRFVVFTSGDENDLEFDPAGLPQLPAGWKRDYFFFADGFTKDMDFYAANAYSVDPLPFHKMSGYPYPATQSYPGDATHLNYLLDYNTRPISEVGTPAYRFRFPPALKD
ncbi:MAG TPA: FG-GAP-like repeat-containing protein [Candidatus Limnocylindrales bacterium]|nr:FG-GAP-like repeat-containing protein [Candidatus Limnocylindrales bacterium]